MLNESEMLSSLAGTSRSGFVLSSKISRHHSSPDQGVNPDYGVDLGKNCKIPFSELSSKSSSGKRFLLDSASTKRPHD